jgi:hypothetical protein
MIILQLKYTLLDVIKSNLNHVIILEIILCNKFKFLYLFFYFFGIEKKPRRGR